MIRNIETSSFISINTKITGSSADAGCSSIISIKAWHHKDNDKIIKFNEKEEDAIIAKSSSKKIKILTPINNFKRPNDKNHALEQRMGNKKDSKYYDMKILENYKTNATESIPSLLKKYSLI